MARAGSAPGGRGLAVRRVVTAARPLVSYHYYSLFKTVADTTESAFNYYENALARPSRKYAIDLNKKVMDTVISA